LEKYGNGKQRNKFEDFNIFYYILTHFSDRALLNIHGPLASITEIVHFDFQKKRENPIFE